MPQTMNPILPIFFLLGYCANISGTLGGPGMPRYAAVSINWGFFCLGVLKIGTLLFWRLQVWPLIFGNTHIAYLGFLYSES